MYAYDIVSFITRYDQQDLSKQCQSLASPNPFAVFLAGFILVGILVSYFPQHYKIISRRSSEGLSPWWVLLGSLSSIAAIGNILVLPASRADIQCCQELDGGSCAAALLGVAQIGCQWACFMFIVMLFFIFFPTVDLTDSVATLGSTAPVKRRDAVIVGGTTLLALAVVFITSVALVAAWPQRTQGWADALGSIAGALAAIQYLPQIYYTYMLGDVKSLSLVTMLIQFPGSFLFAFSLFLRVGGKGWSTWLVYIITGVLQGVLFVLGVYFYWVNRQEESKRSFEHSDDDEGETNVEGVDGVTDEETGRSDERAPLLRGSQARDLNRAGQSGSYRNFDMLYAATPPEQDSDPDRVAKGKGSRRKRSDGRK